MKKFLFLQISIILLMCSCVGYCENLSDEKSTMFSCYDVSTEVFDEFLEDLNNINIIHNNSELAYPNEYGYLSVSGLFSLKKEEWRYLSDYYNVCQMLYDAGLESEVISYAFIRTWKMHPAFSMPLTVWINTVDGVVLAEIYKSNRLREKNIEGLDVTIIDKEKYIDKYRYKPAKFLINEEDLPMSYAYIRNNGALFSLRDLMEGVGVEVIWNDEDGSVFLRSDNNEYTRQGLKIIIDYEKNNSMTVIRLWDNYEIDWLMFNAQYFACQFIENKMIIDNNQAFFFLRFFSENDNIPYITINNENSVVNCAMEVD